MSNCLNMKNNLIQNFYIIGITYDDIDSKSKNKPLKESDISFSPKIISNINFEYSSINVDTFDDYNKLKCFSILIGNFTTCYLVVIILFNFFKKKANTEYERRKNKMNVKNE